MLYYKIVRLRGVSTDYEIPSKGSWSVATMFGVASLSAGRGFTLVRACSKGIYASRRRMMRWKKSMVILDRRARVVIDRDFRKDGRQNGAEPFPYLEQWVLQHTCRKELLLFFLVTQQFRRRTQS